MEEVKFQKSEKVLINEKYEKLFETLEKKTSLFDERLIKKFGKQIGFNTSDSKVYKLLSVLSEKMFDDILTSINHKNIREIETISNKIFTAKKDESKFF